MQNRIEEEVSVSDGENILEVEKGHFFRVDLKIDNTRKFTSSR